MFFIHMSRKLCDPELQRLATHIPVRVIESKAPSTVDKYSRAFNTFKTWTEWYDEIESLPADIISVSMYLENLIQNNSPYSTIESAFYGISRGHKLHGYDNPCGSGMVKNVLEAGKCKLAKPVLKKEPVTVDMIANLCAKYALPAANLSELHIAAICVTAFNAFLRFNELGSLHCCDVTFSKQNNIQSVELYILKSKTDIYRDGNKVLLAETKDISCPFTILKRYTAMAKLELCSL